MSRPRPVAPCRLAAGLLLGTRQVAAALVHRHVDQVRRGCPPVACDVATRALLYDLDQVQDTFRGVPRRARHAEPDTAA